MILDSFAPNFKHLTYLAQFLHVSAVLNSLVGSALIWQIAFTHYLLKHSLFGLTLGSPTKLAIFPTEKQRPLNLRSVEALISEIIFLNFKCHWPSEKTFFIFFLPESANVYDR